MNVRSLFLYGQELNPETWAIARMNMLLHGAGDAAEIKLGDTLAAPAFVDGDRIKTVRPRRRQSAVLVEELGPRAAEEVAATRSGGSSTCRRRATARSPSSSTWSLR